MTNSIPPLLEEELGKIQSLFIVDFVNRPHDELNRKLEEDFYALGIQFTQEEIEVIFIIDFSKKRFSREQERSLLKKLRALPEEKLLVQWMSLNQIFQSRGLSMTQQNIRANQFWSKDICIPIRVLAGNGQAGYGIDRSEEICLVFPNREDFWGLDRIPEARLAPFIFSPMPQNVDVLTQNMKQPTQAPYTLLPINLRFSGGNMLVAGDNLLVGHDAILRNLSGHNLGPEGGLMNEIRVVRKRFEYAFPSKNVVFLGVCPSMKKDEGKDEEWEWEKVLNMPVVQNSSPFGILQPTFHLDLCLTPAGPDQDHKHWLIFLGELTVINPPGLPENGEWPELLQRTRDALEDLKRQLEGMKVGNLPVKVVRVPLPIYYHRLIEKIAMISFNGVLVENYSTKENSNMRRIFFPVDEGDRNAIPNWTPLNAQDWERLGIQEKKARKTYEAHGFEIVPIRSNWVAKAFRTRSYLGCYVNVLRREGMSKVLTPEGKG